MFELKDVYASYGEGMVLRHVSLEAPKGRVTCLVGRNGAGKTTTLKSVMGLVKTPQGKILLDVKEIQDLPVYERAKKGIGYVPQGREIFPQLTVEENILLGLEAKKGKGGIPDFIYETFPILNEFRKRKGGDLSGGQQQQLAIARAVAAEPALLILDEPTAGLDPNERIRFRNLLSGLSQDRLVLLSTHIVSDVEYIANEIMLMGDGHIVRSGTPEKIMSSVPDRVWSCTVPRSKAQDWAKEYKVANMKTTSGGVELRILCEERPCPDAKQEEITLEDVFLYYFGEKGGDEDGLL